MDPKLGAEAPILDVYSTAAVAAFVDAMLQFKAVNVDSKGGDAERRMRKFLRIAIGAIKPTILESLILESGIEDLKGKLQPNGTLMKSDWPTTTAWTEAQNLALWEWMLKKTEDLEGRQMKKLDAISVKAQIYLEAVPKNLRNSKLPIDFTKITADDGLQQFRSQFKARWRRMDEQYAERMGTDVDEFEDPRTIGVSIKIDEALDALLYSRGDFEFKAAVPGEGIRKGQKIVNVMVDWQKQMKDEDSRRVAGAPERFTEQRFWERLEKVVKIQWKQREEADGVHEEIKRAIADKRGFRRRDERKRQAEEAPEGQSASKKPRNAKAERRATNGASKSGKWCEDCAKRNPKNPKIARSHNTEECRWKDSKTAPAPGESRSTAAPSTEVKEAKPKPGREPFCRRCGTKGHKPRDCGFKEAVCWACHQVGHKKNDKECTKSTRLLATPATLPSTPTTPLAELGPARPPPRPGETVAKGTLRAAGLSHELTVAAVETDVVRRETPAGNNANTVRRVTPAGNSTITVGRVAPAGDSTTVVRRVAPARNNTGPTEAAQHGLRARQTGTGGVRASGVRKRSDLRSLLDAHRSRRKRPRTISTTDGPEAGSDSETETPLQGASARPTPGVKKARHGPGPVWQPPVTPPSLAYLRMTREELLAVIRGLEGRSESVEEEVAGMEDETDEENESATQAEPKQSSSKWDLEYKKVEGTLDGEESEPDEGPPTAESTDEVDVADASIEVECEATKEKEAFEQETSNESEVAAMLRKILRAAQARRTRNRVFVKIADGMGDPEFRVATEAVASAKLDTGADISMMTMDMIRQLPKRNVYQVRNLKKALRITLGDGRRVRVRRLARVAMEVWINDPRTRNSKCVAKFDDVVVGVWPRRVHGGVFVGQPELTAMELDPLMKVLRKLKGEGSLSELDGERTDPIVENVDEGSMEFELSVSSNLDSYRKQQRAQRDRAWSELDKDSQEFIRGQIDSARKQNFSSEQLKRLLAVMIKFAGVFQSGLVRGGINLPPVEFKVVTEEGMPRCKPRRLSDEQQKFLNEEIQRLLMLGVIEESESSFASPVVIVAKKELEPGVKRWRFCVNLIRLNNCIKGLAAPLPRLDKSSSYLDEAKFFATFDAVKGYFQMRLAEKCREYTAFVTPDGLYQFKRLPMGLKISAAVFQQGMQKICGGLLHHGVLVYVDDFLVYGNSIDQLIDRIEAFLARCEQFNLSLSREKAVIGVREVEYCGLILENGGIRVPEKRVKNLQKFVTPDTAGKLQSWLGAVNWISGFIKGYAVMVAPLFELLSEAQKLVSSRKGRKLEEVRLEPLWSARHEKARVAIMHYLRSKALKLFYPEPGCDIVVVTDACNTAFGATVFQCKWKVSELKGTNVKLRERELYPIAFTSKSFKGAEKNWSIVQKEAWAIVHTFKQFHPLLTGREVHVFTDHLNLIRILDPRHIPVGEKKGAMQRLQRWAMYMSQYEVRYWYLQGEENTWADYLSRETTAAFGTDDDLLEPWDLSVNAIETILSSEEVVERLSRVQKLCAEERHALAFEDDRGLTVLRENDSFRLWMPIGRTSEQCKAVDSLKATILRRVHGDQHLSARPMVEALRDLFVWKNLVGDVRRWSRLCPSCQAARHGAVVKRPLGRTMPAKHRGEVVHMDYVHLGKAQASFDLLLGKETRPQWLMVMVDGWTGYVHLVPAEKCDAKHVRHCLKQWKSLYGIPKAIVTDNASYFSGRKVEEWCFKYKTVHHFCTPLIHWSNGKVERTNEDVVEKLRKVLAARREPTTRWNDCVFDLIAILNELPREKLAGYCPKELFNGFRPGIWNNEWFSLQQPTGFSVPRPSGEEAVAKAQLELVEALEERSDVVYERILKQERLRGKRVVLKGGKAFAGEPGDFVFVAHPDQLEEMPDGALQRRKKRAKLQLQFDGPFEVVEVRSPWKIVVRRISKTETHPDEITHTAFVREFAKKAEVMDAAGEVDIPDDWYVHAEACSTRGLRVGAVHDWRVAIATDIEERVVEAWVEWKGLPMVSQYVWVPMRELLNDEDPEAEEAVLKYLKTRWKDAKREDIPSELRNCLAEAVGAAELELDQLQALWSWLTDKDQLRSEQGVSLRAGMRRSKPTTVLSERVDFESSSDDSSADLYDSDLAEEAEAESSELVDRFFEDLSAEMKEGGATVPERGPDAVSGRRRSRRVAAQGHVDHALEAAIQNAARLTDDVEVLSDESDEEGLLLDMWNAGL